jgi:hypothetical protein
MQKSDRSWNTIFDSMKNLDWSTTSFDAQTASKLEDLFVQYRDEHITETRRVQYALDSTQKVQKCHTSTSSTAARGQEDLVDAPSYETSPLSIGGLIPQNQGQTSHSNISEIFSTIYTAEAEGTSTISWPMPNKRFMAQLKIMPQKAIREMDKKDYWRPTTKSVTFATDMNGNLNNNIEKAIWILLTELKKESELLNANQKFVPRAFWNISENTHVPH